MSAISEKLAQMSGRYSDEEWAALARSNNPLDQLTVTNARAIAGNILDMESVIGQRIIAALTPPSGHPEQAPQ